MADIPGWIYYHSAYLPATAPDEKPDTTVVESGKLWELDDKKAILARWTTDFDCPQKTAWWYVIKDEPFDISKCSSNARYKINKGKRLFEVRLIDPAEYAKDMYEIQVAAYREYPATYRPHVEEKAFQTMVRDEWQGPVNRIYGAFFRETGALAGYVRLKNNGRSIELVSQKVKPEYERYQINAGLVGSILDDLKDELAGEYYICDGARNIQHETAFQDYLENYFAFRKAYCVLHIAYRGKVKWIVNLLYPARKVLAKLNRIRMVHKINGVLKMEEIIRSKKADGYV